MTGSLGNRSGTDHKPEKGQICESRILERASVKDGEINKVRDKIHKIKYEI